MVAKKRMKVAEIGSWKGMATIVLACNIAPYKGKVFAIDHWLGSENVSSQEIAKKIDIYFVFKRNMISFGVWDRIHSLVMDSLTASTIFRNGILDLVFIDADHRYQCVKKDILSWLPKLRNGGILCGHDCEAYYSKYPEEIRKKIDEHLEEDILPDIPCHPGVVKALFDIFKDQYSIMPNSTIWYCIKK